MAVYAGFASATQNSPAINLQPHNSAGPARGVSYEVAARAARLLMSANDSRRVGRSGRRCESARRDQLARRSVPMPDDGQAELRRNVGHAQSEVVLARVHTIVHGERPAVQQQL